MAWESPALVLKQFCSPIISMRHGLGFRYARCWILVQQSPADVERHICHPLYQIFAATSLCIGPCLYYATCSGSFFVSARNCLLHVEECSLKIWCIVAAVMSLTLCFTLCLEDSGAITILDDLYFTLSGLRCYIILGINANGGASSQTFRNRSIMGPLTRRLWALVGIRQSTFFFRFMLGRE
jgi:hypothetical protein